MKNAMLKEKAFGFGLLLGLAGAVPSANGALTPMDWTEGDLVVPSGYEVTVSGAEKWNTKLEIHGTMNVNMSDYSTKYYVVAGSSSAPADTTIELGGAAGDTAVLNILQGQMWGRYGNNMRATLYFGSSTATSSARMLIGPSYAQDEEFNTIQFMSGLQPEQAGDSVIDVITLDYHAMLSTFNLYQRNAKPVRITFTNSTGTAVHNYLYRPYLRQFWNGSLFNLLTPGGDIILRGQGSYADGYVTNAPISVSAHGTVSASNLMRFFSTDASSRKACVRTEGDCDFIFDTGVYVKDSTPLCNELNATNIIWGHSGDFVIPYGNNSRAGLRTTVSRVLPHGAQTGIVRVESKDTYTYKRFIDLYGTTQSINGLKLTGGAEILNLAETPAQLVFGEDDTSGTISAAQGVTNSVICRKIGTGTLTLLDASTLPELVVEAGTLLVKGTCRVDRLVMPAGKLSLDANANLSCGSLVYTGRVDVANGAVLTVEDRSQTAIEAFDAALETQPNAAPFGYSSFAGIQETFCKSGSGLMTFAADKLPAGPIAVDEGTLRVVPPACMDEYWRFVFKKTSGTAVQRGSSSYPYYYNNPVNVYLTLGKLSLLSDAGALVNLNSIYQGTVAATALNAGSHAYTHAFFSTRNTEWGNGAEWCNGNWIANTMSASWWSAQAFTNQVLKVDDPTTWETITFRLTNDVRGVAGYVIAKGANVCQQYGDPRTWVLESSADSASVAAGQWTLRDSRTDADSEMKHYDAATDYFNGNKPFALNQLANSGPVFTNAVSVASGAVLELDCLGESVAVGGLTVDLTAGAGTIVGFTPAANGVLRLTNPTAEQYAEGKVLKSRIVLPLTLTNPGAMDNLASWQVLFDGKRSERSTVVYKDGKLVVRKPQGACIVFR